MDARDPGLPNDVERAPEGRLVLSGEADDDVRREVEVAERLELRDVLRRRVAPAHRAKEVVVARLERDVEMARRARRLAERGDEIAREVVHLDGRETKPLDAGQRSGLADQPRQRVSRVAVAEAAEVDAREDDLAVTVRDAPLDLRQHRSRAAATRRAAHERDDAERARERAAVLDLHERTRSLEARVRPDAADRADVSGDGVGNRFARPRDHGDVRCDRLEGTGEVRGAPGHVHAPVRSRSARHGLARLRDGLVRDAAGVDDGDVRSSGHLVVTVAEQALAHGLRVRVRHLAPQEAHGEGRHRSA